MMAKMDYGTVLAKGWLVWMIFFVASEIGFAIFNELLVPMPK